MVSGQFAGTITGEDELHCRKARLLRCINAAQRVFTTAQCESIKGKSVGVIAQCRFRTKQRCKVSMRSDYGISLSICVEKQGRSALKQCCFTPMQCCKRTHRASTEAWKDLRAKKQSVFVAKQYYIAPMQYCFTSRQCRRSSMMTCIMTVTPVFCLRQSINSLP